MCRGKFPAREQRIFRLQHRIQFAQRNVQILEFHGIDLLHLAKLDDGSVPAVCAWGEPVAYGFEGAASGQAVAGRVEFRLSSHLTDLKSCYCQHLLARKIPVALDRDALDRPARGGRGGLLGRSGGLRARLTESARRRQHQTKENPFHSLFMYDAPAIRPVSQVE